VKICGKLLSQIDIFLTKEVRKKRVYAWIEIFHNGENGVFFKNGFI